MIGTRLRAAVGIAVSQLRHYRVRTLLSVLAIALAVLSTTVLASVGFGVLETGASKLDAADRDLWVTGGPMRIAPGSVGGFENSIRDSHRVAAEIDAREDVRAAVPMAFRTVYVGTEADDLATVVGVGLPGGGPSLEVTAGPGFSGGDVHYADGTYDGPMSREVIVGERTAAELGVGVNDTLHVGGTIATARRHEFGVVGISPTFSRFLGTRTVALHLGELQALTGATGTDPAAVIVVTLEEGADREAVARDLERAYPYDVRTNREQLESLLRERALVIASGMTLVVLAVVTGIALTANVLALIVYQQRAELAALKASGVSSATLVAAVAAQALLLGAIGGALGVAATLPLVSGVNLLAERVVGFSGLARVPGLALPGGFAMALAIGAVGGAVAGWRVVRIGPLRHLRR